MDLKQNNNFHLIRLLAACQVIYNHAIYWLHLPSPFYLNYTIELFPGVAVFFVISGFLVTKSYVEAKNLRTYTYFRFLRIYPALWINLLLILFLLYWSESFTRQDIFSYHFISHVLVLFITGNNCPAILCVSDPWTFNGFYKLFPSGVLWTITVELGFYLLVPMIFYYLKNKNRKFIFIFSLSFILSLLFAYLNGYFTFTHTHKTFGKFLNNTIFAYLWIFLLGSLIYIQWDKLAKLIVNQFWKWLGFYIFLSVSASILHHDQVLNFKIINFFNVMRVTTLALVIVSLAYSIQSLNFFPGKIDISYGMYLFHMQIIYSLMFAGYLQSTYLWPVVFLLSGSVGAGSWFLIEKPCLKWKKYLRPSKPLNVETSPMAPLEERGQRAG